MLLVLIASCGVYLQPTSGPVADLVARSNSDYGLVEVFFCDDPACEDMNAMGRMTGGEFCKECTSSDVVNYRTLERRIPAEQQVHIGIRTEKTTYYIGNTPKRKWEVMDTGVGHSFRSRTTYLDGTNETQCLIVVSFFAVSGSTYEIIHDMDDKAEQCSGQLKEDGIERAHQGNHSQERE
jgi:hypothetical protein